MEILSPAGNIECFNAAISGGADAIYMGGKKFGARAFSNNFTDEEIVYAIKKAHLYGVKVYVTVNTLIYEDEVEDFINYIDFLHKNNVDAIIIQDIGMLDLIRKTYPNLEIHASTQMYIHNLEGAKLMEKLGVKRIVLARETPIELVKEIKENVNIEIEIFGYGALCVSYSGQCLMSSLIGNRSGNRGSCVQCCRKKYDLVDNKGKKYNKDKYLLSMKDLNTLDYIKELENIGIDSFKIEGRMKSKEYVYLVTKIAKKSLTSKLTEEDIRNLKLVFNREFTKGYLFNDKNVINEYRPNHVGIKIGTIKNGKILLTEEVNQGDGIRVIGKNDTGLILNYIYKNGKLVNKGNKNDLISVKFNDKVEDNDIVVKTLDKKLMDEIDKEINFNSRKVLIDIKLEAKIGDKLKINYKDNIIEGNFIIEKSINNPITKEDLINRISKTGNTIYKINNINVDMDNNIFIPINEINELKRKLIDILDNRKEKSKYLKSSYSIELPDYKKEEKISILTLNKNQIKFNNDTIYCEEEVEGTILKLPRVIERHKDYNKELLVGELGSVNKYKNIITDYSLNVTNSYSVALLHSLGVKRITLSVELDFDKTKLLIDNYVKRYKKRPNLEVIVYGNIESMITKYDILNHYNLNGSFYLKDDHKYLYPIIRKDNKTIIYHYDKLDIKDIKKYYEIGINYLRYQVIDDKDIQTIKRYL